MARMKSRLSFSLLLIWTSALWNVIPVITSQYEEVLSGDRDTTWLKTPSLTEKREELYKPYQKAIRNKFKDMDSVQDRDLKKSPSPSMELITGDTGVPDFLKENMIRHSVTELSELSKTKQIRKDSIKDCDAIAEGPKLYFTTCPGDLVVITLSGSMKMTCNEIEKRVFYGPVTIKSLTCQQSFIFSSGCKKERSLNIDTKECKETNYWTWIVVQMVLLCLSLITLAIIILWYNGISKGLKVGNKYQPLRRSGCYYTTEIKEYLKGDGSKGYLAKDDPSVLNMETYEFRKHWLVILLTLLICRPLEVKSYSMSAKYDTTLLKHTYHLTLEDSEIIDFGTGKLIRDVVLHTGQITQMFKSGSWSLDTREIYFCQWYKCEALSVCGTSALPFIKMGSLAQQEFKFNNVDQSYYTCQKLFAYCTFGNGCKLIGFEVTYKESDLYTIYAISAGGSHGGEISTPTGCIVEHIEDLSEGALTDYLLVYRNEEDSYLCHSDLFSAKPEMGLLGDLQITGANTTHFATNEVGCVTDYNNRALCRYPEPFFTNIQTMCERVKDLRFKVDIDPINRLISWKQSGQASVVLKCDRQLPFRNNESHCSEFQILVWEIAHSDAHMLLSFRSISKTLSSTFRFPKHNFD